VRSYLYVPVDPASAGAAHRDADAVIVDLTDARAVRDRPAAHAAVGQWLADRPAATLWAQVNIGEDGVPDIRAVVRERLAGVCVAGAESANELAVLAVALAEAEEAVGLPIGTTKVAPLLQSAAAVFAAGQLARAPRVTRLLLGEAELCADLGISPGPDERELLWVRSQAVAASAAAGIAAPIGAACPHRDDPEELRRSTVALRQLGFRGRACVHPAQLPVVHEVFAAEGAPAAQPDTR
jgi:citrate lyase subunit beta / citryl-CoA lyase